jgi:8-oxo-dGTP diphosphatase
MNIVYGTFNRAKFDSMEKRLKPFNIEIVSIADIAPDLIPPEEDGNNPLENARIKARFYYSVLKRPVFSCDSGIYADELPDGVQPGVKTREINNKRLTDGEMLEYYGGLAEKYSNGRLTARYINAICLYVADNVYYEHTGDDIASVPFYIVPKPHPKRVEGFPLDSLSVEIASGKYYYDIERADKIVQYDGFGNFFRRIENKWKPQP